MPSLARQLLRNILTSWLGYGLRIMVGFLFVPYITAVLGTERYGIWMIVFQAIGYLSMLDLGLERSVVRFVAKYSALKDTDSVSRVLSTAGFTYVVLSIVALACSTGIGLSVFGIFKTSSPDVLAEGRRAFLVMGGYFAVRFCLAVWGQALVGMLRSDIVSGLDIGEELVKVGLLAFLLSQGYGLVALATAIFGVNIVRQMATILILRHQCPDIVLDRSNVSATMRRQLFGYARISFAINVAWLIVYGTDSVLLGIMTSSAAAGLYAPAAQIMLYLRNAINSIGTPLAPAVSHLESKNLDDSIRRGYLKGIRYTAFLSVFFSVGIIVFARPFVKLWLAQQYAATADVMMILAVGSAVFLPQIIGNAILFGMEKHRLLLIALGCESAIKIGLSLVLVGSHGAMGMAVASAAAQDLTCVTVYPYVMSRAVGIRFFSLLGMLVRFGVISGLVTAVAALILLRLLPPADWLRFAIDIAAVTASALVTGWFAVLESSDRVRLKHTVFGEPD